jgi:hypothetical protein
VNKLVLQASAFSLVLLASSAYAGSIGTATVKDVTLDGEAATALSYGNGINPQSQGAGGGSTGFAAAFAGYGSGDWARLAAFDITADNGFAISTVALGSALTFTFDKTSGRAGSWTMSNTDQANNVNMDLVFAMHTGGGSGAWLFDEQSIGAGKTLNGTWALNLLNNGGRYSGYSNLTIFGRNYQETKVVPPTKVPEPGTPATLALGMALLAFMARRRKS